MDVVDDEMLISENNDEIVYNCIQLMNLIESYFQESDDTKPYKWDIDHHTNVENEDNERTTFHCFPCIACTSNFYYEQSLNQHLERRTIYIRLYCLKCEVYKTFFNKCKLYYHLYSHKNYLIEPIYKNLLIELIPIEKLNLNKQTFNLDSCDILDLTHDDMLNIEQFQAQLKNNNYKLYKCLICDAVFFTLANLKHHYSHSKQIYLNSTNQLDLNENNDDTYNFNGSTTTTTTINQTDDCIKRNLYFNNIETNYNNSLINVKNKLLNRFNYKNFKFASRCNLVTNLNLIYNKFQLNSNDVFVAEYDLICPECGLCFNNMNIFRTHLISQCLYAIKTFQIKCMHKNCNYIYRSKRLAIDHWTNKHIKSLKYCDLCHQNGHKVYFMSNNLGVVNSNVVDDEMFVIENVDIDNDKQIERHFYDKHADISQFNVKEYVKILYKCDCCDAGIDSNTLSTFETWKSCRKHYVQKLNKYINYINCFICEKNFNFNRYYSHLLTTHKINNLIFCIQCGHIDDGSTTLDEHIENQHKKEANCLNIVIIKNDDYLYQCSNCKLFFAPACTFSHNCMESEPKMHQNQFNYFSPIYIKFNASKKPKDSSQDDKELKEFEENLLGYNNRDKQQEQPDLIILDDDDEDKNVETQKPIVMYKCDVCSSTYQDQDYYNRHIRSHGLYYLTSETRLNSVKKYLSNNSYDEQNTIRKPAKRRSSRYEASN